MQMIARRAGVARAAGRVDRSSRRAVLAAPPPRRLPITHAKRASKKEGAAAPAEPEPEPETELEPEPEAQPEPEDEPEDGPLLNEQGEPLSEEEIKNQVVWAQLLELAGFEVEQIADVLPCTVFAPTAEAVEDWCTRVGSDILSQAAQETWLEAIQAHVVPEVIASSELSETPAEATSAANSSLEVFIKDGQPFVSSNGVTARILQADVPVGQGVAHIIDAVLLTTEPSVKELSPNPPPSLDRWGAAEPPADADADE